MSDYGLFPSYEGHMEQRTGNNSRGFFKDAQGFARLDAGSPTSTAQGFHHHGPRHLIFPYFVRCVALRNLDLLIKTGWSVIVCFIAENAGRE